MRKGLIVSIALVFLFSIAATAAAGPFADVPAKHWAYDSLSQLAKAGIIEGYGDGTFRGDKIMTRYEMAQVVARAMEKSDKADAKNKALIEKLSKEFDAELNSLGVRVTKLEKTTPKVQTFGDMRIRYQTNAALSKTNNGGTSVHRTQYRIRQGFIYTPDNGVTVTGRLVGENRITDNNDMTGTATNSVNDQVELDLANVKFTNAMGWGGDLTLGRQGIWHGPGLLFSMPSYIDAIKYEYGNKAWQQTLIWGDSRYAPGTGTIESANVKANAKAFVAYTNKFPVTKDTNLYAGYMASTTNNPNFLFKNIEFGFDTKMSSDFKFSADWVKNNYNEGVLAGKSDKSAWFVKLNYKGADRNKPGSYGAYITYRKMGHYATDWSLNPVIIDFTPWSGTPLASYQKSYQGTSIGFNQALTKNVIVNLSVDYLKTWGIDAGTTYDPACYLQMNLWW